MSVFVSLYPIYTEPAQALDTLDPIDLAYWKCLDVLQRTSWAREKLPQSHILEVSSFVPIAGPFSIGPCEIIYEGLVNGLKACAKKLDSSLSSNCSDVKMVLDQHSCVSRFPH
jgi:hypothetical protein